MIEAKYLLPLALAVLTVYVIDNATRIKQLKRENNSQNRTRFFYHKIMSQFIAILLVPAICLLISNTLGPALHPGPTVVSWATRLTTIAGVSARDLESLFSLRVAAEAALAVLMLEAVPLLYPSKSPLTLGDFSVLLPRSGSELIGCAFLALIAGIGEELLFRGFIPLGLAGFNLPFNTALFISVLIFALCHLYQGPIGVWMTGWVGALLTAAYVLTGSLVFVITIHVAIDLVGLVIRPVTGMGLRRLFGLVAQSRRTSP